MPKNIVIYSDGTGQAGGLLPDERRSNVYKLFRATRAGPDNTINPEKQHAFYDPGLGSDADGGGLKVGWGRIIYNLLSKATGLGITKNLIDCYAEIVRVYEPGDRIFLFGFSRGAYTVRCVGGVMSLCGVPSQMPDGGALKRDNKTTRRIASEAVKRVYQHGLGKEKEKEKEKFKKQREALAGNFRQKYGSGPDRASVVSPYFIGVWDTVASTGMRWPIALAMIAGGALLCLFAAAYLQDYRWLDAPLNAVSSLLGTNSRFWATFSGLIVLILVAGGFWMLNARYRVARGIGVPFWKSFHLTSWRMRFYDHSLNPKVNYAKHALAIDELRQDFDRAAWTDFGNRSNSDSWFEQVWFAGNHSDVGGSYPETESRLSDIALRWMTDKAQDTENPLLVDKTHLNLFGSAAGMQHDEIKNSCLPWAKKIRCIEGDAPLHETVKERLQLDGVLHYDEVKPYRPVNLNGHKCGHDNTTDIQT